MNALKKFQKALLTCALIFTFQAALGQDDSDTTPDPNTWGDYNQMTWNEFSFGALFVSQDEGDKPSSALLSWVPSYQFSRYFALRANLGISVLKARDEDGEMQVFNVIDTELLGRYSLTPNWNVEAGGGLQTWTGDGGGGAGIVTANLGWNPNENVFRVVNRVYAGYSRLFLYDNLASEFHLGVGFLF